jgi:CheY-like chemotaxis protein
MFRTLLVDDERAIVEMLATVLERGGFEVVTASSAAQGTAILAEAEGFEIVVTDLKMESPLAGFDVVRAAAQAVPRPLIIVLTAFPVPAPDWKNAGADALFIKGRNTWQLPEQLKALLQQRELSASLRRHSS